MRFSISAVVLVSTACGGSQQPKRAGHADAPDDRAPAPATRTIDQWTADDENRHITLSCQNLVNPDGSFRCAGLEKTGLQPDRCAQQLAMLRSDPGDPSDVRAFRTILAGLSVAKSCDEIAAAFQAGVTEARRAAGPKPRTEGTGDSMVVCHQRSDGSFELNSEDVLRRRGLGDRVFSDTASSVDKPIEVCGIYGELQWLTRLTCADGSRPFGKDLAKAHASRKGSRPGKPRCGAPGPFLDIYEVPCPEKRYAVYMDMYECGPGEDLTRDAY